MAAGSVAGSPGCRLACSPGRRVHGWILENYEAAKPEGRPVPLQPPASERLGDLRVPTLVVVGEADEPGTLAAGRHLAASVAGAELVEFPDVAHMIQLEEPERFAQVVLDFLDAAGRSGA